MIPQLHPITARVTLPAEFALREAWEALQRAERMARLFRTEDHQIAADKAYSEMVRAADRVTHDALRGPPTVRQWAEDFYRRTTLPNNQEMGT